MIQVYDGDGVKPANIAVDLSSSKGDRVVVRARRLHPNAPAVFMFYAGEGDWVYLKGKARRYTVEKIADAVSLVANTGDGWSYGWEPA